MNLNKPAISFPNALPYHTPNSHRYPGGADAAVMSTTTDIWTAYDYSGGWYKRGTILEIEYDGLSREPIIRRQP